MEKIIKEHATRGGKYRLVLTDHGDMGFCLRGYTNGRQASACWRNTREDIEKEVALTLYWSAKIDGIKYREV